MQEAPLTIDEQTHLQEEPEAQLDRYALLQELTPTEAQPARLPRKLRIDQLHLAPDAFSFRGPVEQDYRKRTTIDDLARDVRKNRQTLEPLLVVWTSKGWAVANGFLRVAAYKAAEWSKAVPVQVFNGTPTAAMVQAARDNLKVALPLTPEERANAAWYFVNHNNWSRREIARQSGVSERLVSYMRRAKRRLEEIGHKAAKYATWKEAQLATFGTESERKAFSESAELADMLDTLGRSFGKLEYHKVELFAQAVYTFAGRRATQFVREFAYLAAAEEEYEEALEEARYMRDNPDF